MRASIWEALSAIPRATPTGRRGWQAVVSRYSGHTTGGGSAIDMLYKENDELLVSYK